MMFSAAQLHSTVPNASGLVRYSIDFRTVHLDEVRSRKGARNIDSACTGSTMGDYIRGTDFTHLPEEAIAPYSKMENGFASYMSTTSTVAQQDQGRHPTS